jgi:hypothetical protein
MTLIIPSPEHNEPLAVINAAQQTILSQRTPSEHIRWREGARGKQLAYVDHAYVTRLLNEAFGFDWDFEVDQEQLLMVNDQPFEVKCRGRLEVRVNERRIVKMQFGCQPIEMRSSGVPVSLGDAFKGAASDALKKCASLLGVALDLYDSDSEVPAQARTEQATAKQQSKQANQKAKPVSSPEKVALANRIAALRTELQNLFMETWQVSSAIAGKSVAQMELEDLTKEVERIRQRFVGHITALISDLQQNNDAGIAAYAQRLAENDWDAAEDSALIGTSRELVNAVADIAADQDGKTND